MTDDQLQALFVGMERHLDKRADAIKQSMAATEERILADVKERVHVLETKLVSEFWKEARGTEARMRMFDAINAASLERLSGIEERVLNLEKPPQGEAGRISENMEQVIALHFRGVREDGERIPVPNSTAYVVEVGA